VIGGDVSGIDIDAAIAEFQRDMDRDMDRDTDRDTDRDIDKDTRPRDADGPVDS
jgi:hypothetical protein